MMNAELGYDTGVCEERRRSSKGRRLLFYENLAEERGDTCGLREFSFDRISVECDFRLTFSGDPITSVGLHSCENGDWFFSCHLRHSGTVQVAVNVLGWESEKLVDLC